MAGAAIGESLRLGCLFEVRSKKAHSYILPPLRLLRKRTVAVKKRLFRSKSILAKHKYCCGMKMLYYCGLE